MSSNPFSHAVADEAATWLTLLMSGEASDADRARWQAWRQAHAEHERAWQHVEAVTGRLKGLHGGVAVRSLAALAEGTPRSTARRRAMRGLGVLATLGVGAALASRSASWQRLSAQHRTGTGEQREIVLADGSRVLLDTLSAVDVRFDARQRLLRLVAGDVWIVTGHLPSGAPPFVVETREGRVRALGTRFGVRQADGASEVTVQEGAVEITTAGDDHGATRLQAGEQARFTREGSGPVRAAGEREPAWTRGLIVADNLPLADFLAELARYRPGVLRCDPAVANERLSGVFPVRDTDRILQTLPSVLPVQVTARTRYWVTVSGVTVSAAPAPN